MIEDPKWELALLATVQAFYQRILSEQLGGQLPAPSELATDAISHTEDVQSTLLQMHLWIQLLDMAVTPAMLRLGLTSDLDPEVAEALLRYFARHRDDSASNRDKTDLVATFLFRHPRVPGRFFPKSTCNRCANLARYSTKPIAFRISPRSWTRASFPGSAN